MIFIGIDYCAIGARIRAFRKKRGLTQQVLAELSGQEPSNISHIERGATKLGLPTIVSIANALGVSVDELLCDSVEHAETVFKREISDVLADCSPAEIRFFAATIKTLKENLRRYYD